MMIDKNQSSSCHEDKNESNLLTTEEAQSRKLTGRNIIFMP